MNALHRSRRRFLSAAGGLGALAAGHALGGPVGSMASLGYAEIPDGALAEQYLFALPGKVPLIKKTFRPPNFETPVEYFRSAITPNKAFFAKVSASIMRCVPHLGQKIATGRLLEGMNSWRNPV